MTEDEMQINEMTIEQAQKIETAAYVKHHVALQDAAQAYRAGLDLAPWAEKVEATRKAWNDAMDALDLVRVLNGEPAVRR